jgi:hypothetical protein
VAARRQANKNDVEITKIRHATFRRAIDGSIGLTKTGIRCGSFVAVAWFCVLTARALAGNNTSVIAVVRGIFSLSIDRTAMGIVIVLLGGGYANERRLRKKIPSNRVNYIRELEARIDPGRTSSRLDESGRPRKEDLDAG